MIFLRFTHMNYLCKHLLIWLIVKIKLNLSNCSLYIKNLEDLNCLPVRGTTSGVLDEVFINFTCPFCVTETYHVLPMAAMCYLSAHGCVTLYFGRNFCIKIPAASEIMRIFRACEIEKRNSEEKIYWCSESCISFAQLVKDTNQRRKPLLATIAK